MTSKKHIVKERFAFLFFSLIFLGLAFSSSAKADRYNLNVKVENLNNNHIPTRIEVVSVSKVIKRKKVSSFFTNNHGVLNQSFKVKDRYKPEYIQVSYITSKERIPKRFFVDLSRNKVGYMTLNKVDGDCSNLIQLGTDRRLINLKIKQVDSYLSCRGVASVDNVKKVSKRNINSGDRNAYNTKQDFTLGQQFDRQFIKTQGRTNPILKDSEVNQYIKNLTQKIVKASDYPDFPVNVRVIDADVLNAFAVPGGYMYIYRGLIEQSSSEAELAGVVAHELAHILARHSTEGMTQNAPKAGLAQVSSQVAGAVAQRGGVAGAVAQVAGLGVNAGVQAWIAKSSRKFEEEADYLGVQYLYRAGYDTREFANFFKTLQKAKGNRSESRLENLFSSHPSDGERIASILEASANLLPDDPSLVKNTQAYFDVKNRLKQLPKPRASGNVSSQALRSFMSQIGIPAQI